MPDAQPTFAAATARLCWHAAVLPFALGVTLVRTLTAPARDDHAETFCAPEGAEVIELHEHVRERAARRG